MAETVDRFPLFPLGIVLLPSEVVPLHIFEERYKMMIGECLESESEFGIVWLADDGLREVGLHGARDQVLEEMDDGRMNILVAGGRRVHADAPDRRHGLSGGRGRDARRRRAGGRADDEARRVSWRPRRTSATPTSSSW